jgi:diguanylate cyclase (GGDEF)-like protein
MGDQLLESVADATMHKDRYELDWALTRLLFQFLNAVAVELFRLIEDEHGKRLLCRATFPETPGKRHISPEISLSDTTAPPPPGWSDCIARAAIVEIAEAGRAVTFIPIQTDHRDVAGVLRIVTAAALTAREHELISGVLHIIRNHISLLDYSESDTLTGLRNRKTFERFFERIRAQVESDATATAGAGNDAEPYWLALVDIDHFKSINDSYGHLFGDEVLLLMSRLMKRAFRGADSLFRFGGEEFVVVLERTSAAGVLIALDRLRNSVAEYQFPQVRHVTISIGATRITRSDIVTTCVERADAALYYAKNHGRNRVENWEALLSAGKVAPKGSAGEIELF